MKKIGSLYLNAEGYIRVKQYRSKSGKIEYQRKVRPNPQFIILINS